MPQGTGGRAGAYVNAELEDVQPRIPLDTQATVSPEPVTGMPELPRGACSGELLPRREKTGSANVDSEGDVPRTRATGGRRELVQAVPDGTGGPGGDDPASRCLSVNELFGNFPRRRKNRSRRRECKSTRASGTREKLCKWKKRQRACALRPGVVVPNVDPVPRPSPAAGPAPAPVQTNGRYIAIGDSMMAANKRVGKSISEVMAKKLGISGEDNAQGGAAVLQAKGGRPPIPDQYVATNWEYVIMNGGINDLGGKCGNGDEGMAVVDQIVSADASSGAFVDIVNQAQGYGSQVVLVSYPFPVMPQKGYWRCEREVLELTRRYRLLAEGRDGVGMVDSSDYMIAGDAIFFADDGSHPSETGSEVVGLAVAELLILFR